MQVHVLDVEHAVISVRAVFEYNLSFTVFLDNLFEVFYILS